MTKEGSEIGESSPREVSEVKDERVKNTNEVEVQVRRGITKEETNEGRQWKRKKK